MADVRDAAGGNPLAYRNRTAGLWLLFILLTGAFAGISLWSNRAEQQAAEFTLTSTGLEQGVLGEPVTFSLSDLRGKTVVLDFMAVNCASCRILTEDVLKPLYAEHAANPDFVLLSIDTWSDAGSGNTFGGEDDAAIRALQEETGVPWRHARDTDQVYLKYNAVSLPKLVVVDPDGRIVHERVGLQPLSRIEAAVAAAAVGEATPVPVLRLGLAGMAAVAGFAAVFTPCGVGLLPAYLALLIEQGAASAPANRLRRAIVGGFAAATGAVLLYGALALLFWLLGARLRPALPWLGPALGLALVAFGIAALRSGSWSFMARFTRWSGTRPDRGFVAFGAAYALAGFACTGPLFLPLLLAGFIQGPWTGLWVFMLYAAAVAAVLVVAALAVAFGEDRLLRTLVNQAPRLHRVSAIILILGGVAVAAYSAWAEGIV